MSSRSLIGAKAPDVQGKLMALGTMVSINQVIDFEMATRVAAEYGQEIEDVGFKEQDFLEAPTRPRLRDRTASSRAPRSSP